jgi:hypothetical protein
MDKVLSDMLSFIGKYANSQSGELPKPGVSIVSMKERPLAIGNRLGVENLGSFSISEIKGGRLDVVIRFNLWGSGPGEVDLEAERLHGRLLAERVNLREGGFLSVSLQNVSASEEISSLNAWRKYADYRALYEFHYPDADGAESLINRIHLNMDDHLTIISDDMVCWDDQFAPTLEVRYGSSRQNRIGSVSIMAFLPPGWDGQEVTLSTFFNGVRRERNFPSLRKFCDSFDIVKKNGNIKTVELGGKSFFLGCLTFPNMDFPDQMAFLKWNDNFSIGYAAPSFDSDAVVYIRLLMQNLNCL